MPCGPHLIEAVARVLADGPMRPADIQAAIETRAFGHGKPRNGHGGPPTTRSIRYAITELIKQGRAKRKGQQGPVYAVREENA
jgi:hypothetical protein